MRIGSSLTIFGAAIRVVLALLFSVAACGTNDDGPNDLPACDTEPANNAKDCPPDWPSAKAACAAPTSHPCTVSCTYPGKADEKSGDRCIASASLFCDSTTKEPTCVQ